MSEILFLPLEHEIHILSPPCNTLFLLSLTRTMSGTYFSLEILDWVNLNLSISEVIWVAIAAVIIALIGYCAYFLHQSGETDRAKMKEETERKKIEADKEKHQDELKADIIKTQIKEEHAARERSIQARENREAQAIEAEKKEKDKGWFNWLSRNSP